MKNTLKLLVITALVMTASVTVNMENIKAYAVVLYSQDITLAPGWNIMSTPKVVESHRFSLLESVSNFDIYVLNANSTSSWSTMSDMNQTEFTPLYGYFINNKSSTTQTLTLNYKASTTPSQRLFERNFIKSGWYSIGVANPSFVKSNTANGVDINNPSSVLNSISGQYSSVVDMTDPLYRNGLNSVAIADTWTEAVASNINTLNDFRETKGYAIAIRNEPAVYSGFQNNDTTQFSSTSLAVINLSNPDTASMNVYTGTNNISLWQTDLIVSTLPVYMQIITYKMTGSAPYHALANVGLYIDGIKINSDVSYDINSKITFSIPSFSTMLTTGQHVLELRGDVVSGANRNFFFSIENSADIAFSRLDIPSINIPVTVNGNVINSDNTKGKNITVVILGPTIVKDPSFQATNVVGGAANAKVARYKFMANGENTKVNSILLTPYISSSSSELANVAIYLNGSQIGSMQNATSGVPITFNFNAQFMLLAGQTMIVDVRADLVSPAGQAISNGQVGFDISGGSMTGMSSILSYNIEPISGQRLTVDKNTPTLGKTIGAVSANMSANSNNVKIGSFSVQGGSVEGITVRTINLYLTAGGSMNLNNVTSLTLKDESGNILGTPQGIASTAQVYTVNIPVSIGQTKRFDVFANIGSAINGNSVLASTSITYTGMTLNQTGTIGATGDVATVASVLVGNPTVSNKVAAKYVLGGASQDVMTLNVTSQNGNSTINDLTFTVTNSGVQSLTVNGNTTSVIGTMATFTGVNIPVMAGNSGTNMTVKVNYTPAYVTNGTGVVTGTTNSVALTAFKYTDAAGNVTSSTTLPTTTGNTMTLVASLATVNAVNVIGTNSSNVGVGTTNNVKLGSVTVTADSKGDIVVGTLAYSAAGPGTVTVTGVKVAGSAALDKAGVAPTITSATAAFAAGYRITAGTSVVFDIYGTVVNSGTTSGNTSVTLGTASSFLWSDDAASAGTSLNGTLLSNNYNN